jgi:hypothetical protein
VNLRRETDKEPVFDQADDMIQVPGQGIGGDGRIECAIENVMAAIADKRLSVGISTQRRRRAEI